MLYMPLQGIASGKDSVLYDMNKVQIVKPSASAEKELFSDTDLQYIKQEAQDIGWFERFITWLLESLFGKADPGDVANVTRGFIWLIVIVVVAVVIWVLLRSDFTGFTRGSAKSVRFNFTDVEEDISTIDFTERIRKALSNQDQRLAVRWHYLELLHLLNQKQLIAWESFKTNIDYSNELANSSLKKPFDAVSRIYEFAWYGKYEVTTAKYTELKKDFETFKNNIA